MTKKFEFHLLRRGLSVNRPVVCIYCIKLNCLDGSMPSQLPFKTLPFRICVQTEVATELVSAKATQILHLFRCCCIKQSKCSMSVNVVALTNASSKPFLDLNLRAC